MGDERQVRTMTDDEATNMRLEQWWTREMELLQEMVDSGKLSGASIGMAARGLWNMAHKAGAAWALREAAKAARGVELTLNDIDYEREVIAEAIEALVTEGEQQ